MSQQTNSNLTPKNPLGFKIGIHYAWIIIAIAALIHMAGGSIRQAFGVLIIPLEDTMGWSPAAIALGYSIASLTGAFLAPFTGMATDRFGARRVIMVGALFFFIGAILTGLVSEVWHIWISFGLCLGIAQACFNVPILTAASLWFQKRLGFGVGLLQAAHGVGPALASLGVGTLLIAFAWQTTFWSIAFVGGAVLLVLLFLFRSHPNDINLRPYGAPEDEPIREKQDPVIAALRSKTYRQCMQGTFAFWKLVAVHHLGCVGHAIVIIYTVPIAVNAGIEYSTAFKILATLMVVSVFTRFITPVISDFVGSKWTMAIMFMLQGFPVLLLLFTHEVWHFYAWAVIFGIGYGGEGSGFPIINRQYFGRGPMGRSFGWQQFGAGSGMAFGAWIGGYLYYLFGSYNPAIILSTVASVGGALVLISMAPTNKLLIENWEDSLPPEAKSFQSPVASSAD